MDKKKKKKRNIYIYIKIIIIIALFSSKIGVIITYELLFFEIRVMYKEFVKDQTVKQYLTFSLTKNTGSGRCIMLLCYPNTENLREFSKFFFFFYRNEINLSYSIVQ